MNSCTSYSEDHKKFTQRRLLNARILQSVATLVSNQSRFLFVAVHCLVSTEGIIASCGIMKFEQHLPRGRMLNIVTWCIHLHRFNSDAMTCGERWGHCSQEDNTTSSWFVPVLLYNTTGTVNGASVVVQGSSQEQANFLPGPRPLSLAHGQ